jgi:xanthine/CO dehydrogenase XdhC/CoxF family maturation factor
MLFQSRPARSQADMTNSDDNQIKGFMMAGELEQNMLERTQQMALNSGRDSAAAR